MLYKLFIEEGFFAHLPKPDYHHPAGITLSVHLPIGLDDQLNGVLGPD
jgi:hypothetical protein